MPDLSLEQNIGGLVAGIDEAGRGPWAGPVVAAAVILRTETLPVDLKNNLDDSKKLSRKRRETLFETLPAHAAIGVGMADVTEIDQLNILQATLCAMTRAVENLETSPHHALVDGNHAPALACPVECVIKGDSKSLSIAAASIIAKVTRDHIMADLAQTFPGYGWERNAGYGTAEHKAALERLGVTPHHRKSFAPIRKMIVQDIES